LSSPQGVAYHSHLYTRIVAEEETDEFERWIDSEFEAPASEALEKATSEARLTAEDWRRLVRFLAAQDVRTPASFAEKVKRWHATLPKLMEETLQDAVRNLEEASRTGQPLPQPNPQDSAGMPMRTIVKRQLGEEMGQIRAEILVGRELWLYGIQRALEKTLKVLHQHRWTILLPPRGLSWFTSDAPVVRLNFNSLTDYNFGGGWGSPGTEIFLPLGPQHLLYTQIGKPVPRRGERVSVVQADLVRRFIVEHAYRMIFAAEIDEGIPRLRPRIVDAEQFRHEREQWEGWHDQQTAAEKELKRRSGK
jgi:hypothetical protein